MTPFSDLPEAEQKRLKRNEAAQRRETAKRGLPALPVSPEGLWLIQRGMCTCNECRGEVPLVPGKIVIAHPHYCAGKGSPGHVPTNVALWLEACNAREGRKETVALGRGRRLTPDLTRKTDPDKRAARGGSTIQGRPLPGTKASGFKKSFNGKVVRRD